MSRNDEIRELLSRIREMPVGNVNLMEVCGTHTMAIAKSGLKSLLPENVRLLSGPGCPVCVTPDEVIDAVLALSLRQDVIIATYGDMIRVPGSEQGQSLQNCRTRGARIEIVYSPMDAVDVARKNPEKQVVFLGIGFETTAPGTAIAIRFAKEIGIRNFSVFSMIKTVEPALRSLMAEEDFNVQGFLCPGHVATIIGEAGFRFLTEEYHMPAVISGFEGTDILLSVYKLLKQIETGEPRLENEYTRAVLPEGNPEALRCINDVFEPRDDLWRGLGRIPMSGLGIRKEYEDLDAEKRFEIKIRPSEKKRACRCGDVIRGKISPGECPLFGRICTPDNAAGPCMVSGEGACAAAYRYQE